MGIIFLSIGIVCNAMTETGKGIYIVTLRILSTCSRTTVLIDLHSSHPIFSDNQLANYSTQKIFVVISVEIHKLITENEHL